ncbi:MAG: family peptidase [Anaerocolumna sp.]|jgi:serine protease AprX|nr:family peptidase [Anaerocolumna sp.]
MHKLKHKYFSFLALFFIIIIISFYISHVRNITSFESYNSILEPFGYNNNLYSGKNIVVAIIDTGIQIFDDNDKQLLFFKDFTSDKVVPYDDNGHGTAVANIIGMKVNGLEEQIGIAQDTKIVSLKVFNKNGKADIKNLEQCLDWIISHGKEFGINIISMPLSYDQNLATNIESKIVTLGQDYTIIAAAGNKGRNQGPGYLTEVISVGSIDSSAKSNKYEVAVFSPNYFTRTIYNKPDVFSPGVDIPIYSINKKSYILSEGTSFSSAIVTGYVSLLYEKYPNQSTDFYYELILKNTNKDGVLFFIL